MINRKKKTIFKKSLLWRGWGGLLLLIFLFPQVNNALHYFVIEHHFHECSDEKQFYHNHKTHDCEQSIYKIPNILLFDFGYKELAKTICFYSIEKPLYKVFYKKIFFENITNKGPPKLCQSFKL